MSDCRKCVNADICGVDEDCGLFVRKSMTNADRIRTMTDEELAKWIARQTTEAGIAVSDEEYQFWLEWMKMGLLKEEADDE